MNMTYMFAALLCSLVSGTQAQAGYVNQLRGGEVIRFNEPYMDPNTGEAWGHTNSGGVYPPSLVRFCDGCGTTHDTNTNNSDNDNNTNNGGNAA